MKTYIVGNWKSYKSKEQGLEWLQLFASLYRPADSVEVVVAPPFPYLDCLKERLGEYELSGVFLAAQDVSPFPRGGYTGAVAADMLAPVADYVIVGHAERKRYFHETSQDVQNKVTEAVDSGITPILCLEDPADLAHFGFLGDIDSPNLLLAYTPATPLLHRTPEPVEMVGAAVRQIRKTFPNRPVLYGGALNQGNAKDYLAILDCCGLFLGEASLSAEQFAAICNMACIS